MGVLGRMKAHFGSPPVFLPHTYGVPAAANDQTHSSTFTMIKERSRTMNTRVHVSSFQDGEQ